MSRATLPNNNNNKFDRINIKERERELKKEIDKKHAEEPYNFTKEDILAMIIAAYQLIMPIVLIGIIVLVVTILILLKVYS